MSSFNPKSTPADPHVRLSKEMAPSTRAEQLIMEHIPYQQAVGCLNYLTQTTRPDIAFAVNQVSRYCHNPGSQHWEAVKNIFAYLKGTIRYGLCYGGNSGSTTTPLIGHTDSDYAGDLDHFRSTTGYIFHYNNGPISWCSKRQPATASSTTQAEYQALSDGSKEAVFLSWLLQEVIVESNRAVPIFCDNNAAIQLASNPGYHSKTKHINVAYHVVRGFVESRQIIVERVDTKDNLADTLTKPLPPTDFKKFRALIGVQTLE